MAALRVVLHVQSPVSHTRLCGIPPKQGDRPSSTYTTTHQNFGAWLREMPNGYGHYVICQDCANAFPFLEIAEAAL